MDSTVGQQCVNCRQKITKAVTATFCPDCGCPCHLECGRPQQAEMQNFSCLTCGAPRAEVTRYKNEREFRLVNQLSKQKSAPPSAIEGRKKIALVIGCMLVILGFVRFGLATAEIEFASLGTIFFALIPLVAGFVTIFTTLYLAQRDGW